VRRVRREDLKRADQLAPGDQWIEGTRRTQMTMIAEHCRKPRETPQQRTWTPSSELEYAEVPLGFGRD